MPKYHVMKAYREHGGKVPRVIFGTGFGCFSDSWVGRRAGVNAVVKRKIPSPCFEK